MPLDVDLPPFKPTFIAKQLARAVLRDEPDGVWRCRYCRREVVQIDLPPADRRGGLYPEREHVVPKVRGGTNEFANLAVSCQRCNVSKGDLLLSELPEAWPHVPASHPNRCGGWRS